MGMYTGVRARVKVKGPYRRAIEKLHHEGGWDNVCVRNVEGWLKFFRHDFIPFGGLAYMPGDFQDPFESESTFEGGSKFDGKWWTFSCSLKNYENEIEFFMKNVLCHLVSEVDYCMSLYEEFPYPNDAIFGVRTLSRDEIAWWGRFCKDWTDVILGNTQESP